MPGGLLQITYNNNLDFPFTSNPSINFFKAVYKQYHSFGTEYIDIHTIDINNLSIQHINIPRNGSLIKDMYLETFFYSENIENAVYGLGNAMIKEITFEIGGQVIDRQYGEWLNIWSELTIKPGERIGYDNMVGNNSLVPQNKDKKYVRVVTPLQFFFNQKYGLAIPLNALQYHNVEISIIFNNPLYLSKDKSNPIKVIRQPKLFCEYIRVVGDTRRYFATTAHEYLMTAIYKDYTNHSYSNNEDINMSMILNHPTRELIIVAQEVDDSGNVINPCQFVPIHEHIDNKFILKVDNQIIFEGHGEDLLFQQNSKHTNIPRCNRAITTNNSFSDKNSIIYETNSQYIYSIQFGLDPESFQPNGTFNFSAINNKVVLDIVNNSYNKKIKISVFTQHFNILRIMSGMGGMSHSS